MASLVEKLGLGVGALPRGPRNALTDVPGVRVGHATVDDNGVQTGVTAVIPAPESLFRQKVPAGCAVFNGFGKSMGLLQVQEKGTIETPIVLTGVSSAGSLYEALFRRSMDEHPEICTTAGSVNPVVCECNDSYLNDARAARLGRPQLDAALAAAAEDFQQGAVGAGRGMSCFGLKGGIGSASRLATTGKETYTVGVLVNANFGVMTNLVLAGHPVGAALSALVEARRTEEERESGSIILVLGTDAPLTARQLARMARRCFVGVGRTGSFVGDGSGDVAVAFSNAFRIPHEAPEDPVLRVPSLHERGIDPLFQAAAEAAEEAILSALLWAVPVRGRGGHVRRALRDFLPELDAAGLLPPTR